MKINFAYYFKDTEEKDTPYSLRVDKDCLMYVASKLKDEAMQCLENENIEDAQKAVDGLMRIKKALEEAKKDE